MLLHTRGEDERFSLWFEFMTHGQQLFGFSLYPTFNFVLFVGNQNAFGGFSIALSTFHIALSTVVSES